MIDGDDLNGRDLGERILVSDAASAAIDLALFGHGAEELLQLGLLSALEGEGAYDLPLADTVLALTEKLENLGLARDFSATRAFWPLRHRDYASSGTDSSACVFLRRAGFLPLALPFPFAALAAISSKASSSVTSAGVLSCGSVALTFSHFT